jgi:hypothetical protein
MPLVWLDELRATTRDPVDAASFRYCRRRGQPGESVEKASWGGVTYLFEVDEGRVPVRQIQIYDRAETVHRFNRDHPYRVNALGERVGGGLRTEPFSEQDVEESAITHQEFEHAWLTGHLGERTVAEYHDQLLIEACDGEVLLWQVWAIADSWYPYLGAAGTLALGQQAIEHLVDRGLVELIDVTFKDKKMEVVPFPATQSEALIRDRLSWLAPPKVWYQITDLGLDALRLRGKIRS